MNRSIPSCTIFFTIGMIVYFFFGDRSIFWGDFFWSVWGGYTICLLINESRLPIDRSYKNFGLLLFGSMWIWYLILPFFDREFSVISTYIMGFIYLILLGIMIIFGVNNVER